MQTIVKVFPEEIVCNYLDKFDFKMYPSSFKKHFLIDVIKRNSSFLKRNNFLDHEYLPEEDRLCVLGLIFENHLKQKHDVFS